MHNWLQCIFILKHESIGGWININCKKNTHLKQFSCTLLFMHSFMCVSHINHNRVQVMLIIASMCAISQSQMIAWMQYLVGWYISSALHTISPCQWYICPVVWIFHCHLHHRHNVQQCYGNYMFSLYYAAQIRGFGLVSNGFHFQMINWGLLNMMLKP